MVVDHYANDGVRSDRGWRTEIEGAETRRLAARAKGRWRRRPRRRCAVPRDARPTGTGPQRGSSGRWGHVGLGPATRAAEPRLRLRCGRCRSWP